MKIWQVLPTVVLLLASLAACAQTVPVMMLSDIHFDPFHDPAKVAKLRALPVEEWEGVLTSPDTATQASDFAALQHICGARGVDTPMPLLLSSLAAEKKAMAQPLFVTVSGDLMAHQFDCRFKAVAGVASAAEYAAFASKTVAFVVLETKKTFRDTPVYFALGNNDSGCHDYAEDMNSAFLQADARSLSTVAHSAGNAEAITHEFPQLGDYTVALPAPFAHTRLIVLQDIFEAKPYHTCADVEDPTAAARQLDWLRGQLKAAKSEGESVWVMAHIPPGVDAYATLIKAPAFCIAGAPAMFLGSSGLSDALAAYGGTVRLGLFGHTHMDEMKLLHSATGPEVPMKLVPSISPVDGNNPAFTVARVDPLTATLVDYTVFSASNQTGLRTVWSEEYTYSSTYKKPDFSAASVSQLMEQFRGDTSSLSEATKAYQSFYYVGGSGVGSRMKAAAMHILWHGYACSLTEMDAGSFRACACAAK